MGDNRSYVSGYFQVDLDGMNCGMVQKFEGGNISADVVSEPVSDKYLVKKHIGNLKYNDFSLQMVAVAGTPMTEWVEAALSMNYQRKSGELKAADFQLKVRSIREFKDALVTEVGFPACDGASKEPAFMSVKFAPEVVRTKAGDGSTVDAAIMTKQKMWSPANFRLNIDGLSEACKRVNKVDALTAKITTVRDEIGDARDYALEPGKIEMPNLSLTLTEADAKAFYEWHEDFVIRGNCHEENEKTGSLVYLDHTRQKTLCEISFSNIGIFNVTADPVSNNDDKIRRVKVECYLERMKAKFSG